ncbi:MAG: ABC transporter ATP-binding protein/permease [Bacteroidales bacterium]|nr:ABC transporter ATP-binding protein/permease [Bacteroidales bacterium]
MRNAFYQRHPKTGENTINKSALLRIFKMVFKNYKYAYLIVMVCILVTSGALLTSTLFTRQLIDKYIVPLTQMANPEYSSLFQALFKLAIVLFFGVLCSYLNSRIMINVTQGMLLKLRKMLFEHIETLPLNFFYKKSKGEIMSAFTNDIDTLRQLVGRSVPEVVETLVTIIATFCSMIVLNIPLTGVSIVIACTMAFATTKLTKKSRSHFRDQQQHLANMNGYIEEMVSGQKVVKVFCHEQEAINKFEILNEKLRESACNAQRIGSIVMPVNANLGNLGYVLIAVIGATLALCGWSELSLGTLVAFLSLNKSFTHPIARLSHQINDIITASSGAERVFKIMDEEPEKDGGTTKLVYAEQNSDGFLVETEKRTGIWAWKTSDNKLVKLEGGIEFKNVDFSYTSDTQVLYNIDLKAHPHQKIAFVGGTGAGKTTIANLINRFYDINQGKIYYDGLEINTICKSDLRHSMSVVLQETHLFTASVLDNIRYGKLDATDEECINSAKLIGADNFIKRLPDGYNTILTGGGVHLSQGERQLLAIARATVANPPVIILDEATSSVNTRTELMVQQAMDKLMQGRTTFVIAHRLSTVRNADCINVLEHGKIIEQGTHQELIDKKGNYYNLIKSTENTDN